MSPAEIETFARDQDDLLRTSYRWDLWGAAFVINGGCSDDGFDYFRGWLLLQGREVWNAALRDPESLAEIPLDGDPECEDVLYAAGKAYESATGHSLPSRTEPPPSEPAGTAWAETDLETLYPRLSKRLVAVPTEQVYRVRPPADEWDRQMESGMALLASGAFEPAARAFASVRKGAPRLLTRTIATNNLAWTDLMIGTQEAVKDALQLANEALKMIEAEPQKSAHVGGVRGTLAFALIENDQVEAGLSLIKQVLAADPSGPQFLALRLCVQAIGLARSGDAAGARRLTSRARKTDPGVNSSRGPGRWSRVFLHRPRQNYNICCRCSSNLEFQTTLTEREPFVRPPASSSWPWPRRLTNKSLARSTATWTRPTTPKTRSRTVIWLRLRWRQSLS
jgi:hypothetical protein